MPLYEYECPDCGYRFELMRSVSDRDSPTHCQNPNEGEWFNCTDGAPRRVPSASNFRLKGGGWYADGYSKTPD